METFCSRLNHNDVLFEICLLWLNSGKTVCTGCADYFPLRCRLCADSIFRTKHVFVWTRLSVERHYYHITLPNCAWQFCSVGEQLSLSNLKPNLADCSNPSSSLWEIVNSSPDDEQFFKKEYETEFRVQTFQIQQNELLLFAETEKKQSESKQWCVTFVVVSVRGRLRDWSVV